MAGPLSGYRILEIAGIGPGRSARIVAGWAEQKVVREWVDEQAAQQAEVAGMLRELAGTMRRKGA